MKYLKISLIVLRYRVAIMLLIFYVIGIASQQHSQNFSPNYIWGFLALVFGYIVATTINDIADQKIDKINHSKNKSRLLISKKASTKDMLIVNITSALLAFFFATLINQKAQITVGTSLFLSYIYSLKPFQISHKPYLAPMLLTTAYVGLPYTLGVFSTNTPLQGIDILLVVSLGLMFFGRIILKDFRDRKGDKKYNKQTILLNHGKNKTIFISALSMSLGIVLLILTISRISPLLSLPTVVYLAMMLFSAKMLFDANTQKSEQVAIGIGAKMGNGLLITVLATLILKEYGAQITQIFICTSTITALYVYTFKVLISNPQKAILGYKG